MLESRLSAEQDRISELEQSVVEARQDATTSEQLLIEVSQTLTAATDRDRRQAVLFFFLTLSSEIF